MVRSVKSASTLSKTTGKASKTTGKTSKTTGKTSKTTGKTSKGELSKKKIISKTRELLAEKDLHSLTLDTVAERSGIAKSSILWYFGSKNGLLLAIIENIFDDIQKSILEVDYSSMSVKERLEKIATIAAREMTRTPEANALMISFIVNKSIDPIIVESLQQMYDSYRMFIQNVLSEYIELSREQAALVLAVIDGAYLQWYLQPKKISLKKVLSLLPRIIVPD